MKLHSNTATPEVHAARVNQKLLEWEHEQPSPIDIATDYVDLENDLGCVVSINAHISYKYADMIEALPSANDVERLLSDKEHRKQEIAKYQGHNITERADDCECRTCSDARSACDELDKEIEKLTMLLKIVTYHAAQKGR